MAKCLYLGVDLQEGFLNEEIRTSDYIDRVEEYLAGLSAADILLTRFVNNQTSAFAKYLEWPKMQRGDENTKLLGNLESRDYKIIEKSTYTSFVDAIKRVIASDDYDTVVILGLDTEACVLKTALDVFDEGLRPVVLSDLCRSGGGQERHQAGLELLRSLVGNKQITTSQVFNPAT